MTQDLSIFNSTLFHDSIIKQYQSEGTNLVSTLSEKGKRDITNNANMTFRKTGTLSFKEKGAIGSQQETQMLDLGTINVTAMTYMAKYGVDDDEDLKNNVNIKEDAKLNLATSGKRLTDQLVINALGNTSSSEYAKGHNIGTTQSPLTSIDMTTITQIRKYFGKKSIGPGMRYLLLPTNLYVDLMNNDKLTNSLYSTFGTIQKGNIQGSIMQTNIVEIDDRPEEGGLPASGTGADRYSVCYAYSGDALAYVYKKKWQIMTWHDPDHNTYKIGAKITAGCDILQGEGIIRIYIKDPL